MNGDGDSESWLSGWEQQCADSVDEQPDFEQSLRDESENSHTRIWTAFQDSAAAIAQLYRDRVTGEPATLWLQFQTAAGTVTSLYKESSEGLRKSSDLAKQCGYQKRNKEILNWAKRKRRLICREDLLAYLSGKLPPKPNHHQYHHHNHHSRIPMSPRPRNISPPPGVAPPESLGLNSELHTFREALARSPLSCIARGPDLCAFITGEMARHCKRPASPSDVTMDSPTQQKRPRYM
ncbi:HUWE1-associated protein modifying stress responses isoform X1 [Tribolium castaneum]|uniref:HUWE1-associated protein modifying stress responses isoform X1 n=1 Tax=Tribolium castaneum TaxID=7070 RepID=UPI00046C1295|nr:PREDICTED: UPF0472 protein C16orf72 homolog isoform X2 [Tribolium castaneum]|eukprot:XP_008197096.1 PREDICTED: UPF0472 protein C16orf72 homolog isoform X2 [Tribolium castaneum]